MVAAAQARLAKLKDAGTDELREKAELQEALIRRWDGAERVTGQVGERTGFALGLSWVGASPPTCSGAATALVARHQQREHQPPPGLLRIGRGLPRPCAAPLCPTASPQPAPCAPPHAPSEEQRLEVARALIDFQMEVNEAKQVGS